MRWHTGENSINMQLVRNHAMNMYKYVCPLIRNICIVNHANPKC